MPNIVWLKEISKDDVGLVGGKAANLGEMFNSRFPVPPAFVVTSSAYKGFLSETGIQDKINSMLSNLDVEDTDVLQHTAKEIQDLILSKPIPDSIKRDIVHAYENLNISTEVLLASKKALSFIKSGRDLPFVAVRSSATAEDLPEASFAGQQETYLNVKGADKVVLAVQKCFASLYTARAIYYRVKNNFEHSKVLIAVVVQKMIDSEKAGVTFSVNPSNNKDEIIIEASFGLGDAVVSGAISPDKYIVQKDGLKIIDKKINNKDWMNIRDANTGRTIKRDLSPEKANSQCLSDDEIIKIASLTKRIERHYEKPQDVEFAIESGRIYIVQSRAITTLGKEVKEVDIEGEVILKGIAAAGGVGSGTVKILTDVSDLNKVGEGDVLVAKMTKPDYVPAMKRASAIVTDEGGLTSHAAIVSRELGIPCVVGSEKATTVLKEGQKITVNGSSGEVYSGINDIKVEEEKYDYVETKTKIKVNLDMPDAVEKAVETKADGVGLFRIEFIIAENGVHPLKYIKEGRSSEYVSLLKEKIKLVAKSFEGKQVWVRASDIRSDEYENLDGAPKLEEDNPMMGWHGIRMGLDEDGILKAELEAVRQLKEEGLDNVLLMIPFVSHIEQVKKVKELINDFGVMIEIPASVEIIEDICKEGIKFASFGTNDLTQFTLAIDRNNSKVQGLFDELHPAVLSQIKRVIDVCKRYNVETSICGQAGSNPEMAKYLVKCGIDSISANVDAVGKIRHFVAEEEKNNHF